VTDPHKIDHTPAKTTKNTNQAEKMKKDGKG